MFSTPTKVVQNSGYPNTKEIIAGFRGQIAVLAKKLETETNHHVVMRATFYNTSGFSKQEKKDGLEAIAYAEKSYSDTRTQIKFFKGMILQYGEEAGGSVERWSIKADGTWYIDEHGDWVMGADGNWIMYEKGAGAGGAGGAVFGAGAGGAGGAGFGAGGAGFGAGGAVFGAGGAVERWSIDEHGTWYIDENGDWVMGANGEWVMYEKGAGEYFDKALIKNDQAIELAYFKYSKACRDYDEMVNWMGNMPMHVPPDLKSHLATVLKEYEVQKQVARAIKKSLLEK